MDIKTTFLNGELDKVAYMKQSKGFSSSADEHLVCKLKKFIYRLEQTHQHMMLLPHLVSQKTNIDYCI